MSGSSVTTVAPCFDEVIVVVPVQSFIYYQQIQETFIFCFLLHISYTKMNPK